MIAAIGAFTPGYVMILSKELIPSLSLVKEEKINELRWLIEQISIAQKKIYNRNVIYFEHGMCACVGGLDRAHLHLMTIDKKVKDKNIIDSINNSLVSRKAGINSVELFGHKLENIHDIKQVMESNDKNEIKIDGKQLYYNDILDSKEVDDWMLVTRKHVFSGGHYVFFRSISKLSSFLTLKNFQTQLGRQIAYEIEISSNKKFKKKAELILKQNPYANIWKWQEFAFNENILITIRDFAKYFSKNKKKIKAMYNFKLMFKG